MGKYQISDVLGTLVSVMYWKMRNQGHCFHKNYTLVFGREKYTNNRKSRHLNTFFNSIEKENLVASCYLLLSLDLDA